MTGFFCFTIFGTEFAFSLKNELNMKSQKTKSLLNQTQIINSDIICYR
ncbi:hypothetical protein FBBAL38_04730 [Flavobacteria bacterium BAL38]|nr:hypothetical protein FBBAL38_04730 [Flavobacteria bacterium BAL38]